MVRDTLIVDPRKIAVNYLTSFFVIDFVSTIPFEFFITSKKSSQITLLDKYPLVRWEITGIAEKRLRESTLL